LIVKKSTEIGGKTISIEVGRMARLAHGSAVVTLGETVVLCTVGEADARPGIDFFPLTIEYREKTYAAGKIPGGFFKREGRPTTKEVLGCRLIDRPIRPLFAEGYLQDVQVICYVLSYDGENDADVLAGLGASTAIMASGIPLEGPVAWARVGCFDGELRLFPNDKRLDESGLDLVVAGTRNSVTMVEAAVKELPESKVLDAIAFGHEAVQSLCALQDEVLAELGITPGRETWEVPEDPFRPLLHTIREECQEQVRANIVQPFKPARQEALKPLGDELVERYGDLEETGEEGKWPVKAVKKAFRTVCDEVLRELIVDHRRVDGRTPTEVRPIQCDVGVLPRAHGSALFTRGETQALVTATLGTGLDEQVIDGLQDEYSKSFILHYNFPPFSVGEVRPIRGTSRRELGHGNLAERALAYVQPHDDDFPYTLRLVSEILMSNGSSSMASVCGGSLAMLDAGVKIKSTVAGIAMGLVKEGERVVVLSDILGDEDHAGDMDFKVAGTAQGITALQMDIKIDGVSRGILEQALAQARDGRLHILAEMAKAIDAPRKDYSPWAPRLISLKINPEKIGTLIGPGGKTIRQIQEETGCTVEVTDDGTVKVFSTDGEGAQAAVSKIEDLTAEAEVGAVYEGRVVQMRDFGVFVQILPNQDGMVHVSELSDTYVERPGDVVSIGDVLRVKCIDVDASGKVRLSRRALLLEERGEDPGPPPGRGGGGGRGRGRGRGGESRGRGEGREAGRGRGDRDRDRDRGGDRGRDRDRDRDRGGDRGRGDEGGGDRKRRRRRRGRRGGGEGGGEGGGAPPGNAAEGGGSHPSPREATHGAEGGGPPDGGE
jgi:polyribonucleotide nucleotidyltransferase